MLQSTIRQWARRMVVALALVAGAHVALAGDAAVASEHEGSGAAAIVVIPGELREQPIPGRGGATWRVIAHRVVVHADGERCIVGELAGGGDAELPVGTAEQPGACSTPGARVSITLESLADFGTELDATFTIAEETETFVVDDFAPLPPPLGEPLPEGETGARVVIPRDTLEGRLGQDARAVTVFANGETCGAIDTHDPHFVDDSGGAFLALGDAGQPEACRTPGALVTFRSEQFPGEDVLIGYWLEPGTTMTLTDFATEPPSLVPDTPSPPAAGTGLARSADGGPVALPIALAAALVALSGAAFFLANRGSMRPHR